MIRFHWNYWSLGWRRWVSIETPSIATHTLYFGPLSVQWKWRSPAYIQERARLAKAAQDD